MKKFTIGFLVVVFVGAVFGGPPSPPVSRIPMQILEEVKEGGLIRMSVVVPDSVERSEANLRNVGEQIRSVTNDASHVFVDIFTNVDAFKARKRMMTDERNTASDKANYDQHFLAQYIRNSKTGYHGIGVAKENVTTLPKKIDF